MKAAHKNSRVFTQVDYRQFRQHMADTHTKQVKGKGFETIIFDHSGDIQAIMHAASIDEAGNCYPAEYFIRTAAIVEEAPWCIAA